MPTPWPWATSPASAAAPGESTDPAHVRAQARAFDEARDRVFARYGIDAERPDVGYRKLDRATFAKFSAEIKALQGRFEVSISGDLVANRLLDLAARTPSDDPSLRDGIARGLDRLGPAGADALAREIRSGDPKRGSFALFALQAGRSDSARGTLLALIADRSIPADGLAESFRTLREFGPSVPPSAVADFLRARDDAPAGARAAALRVLAAMPSGASEVSGPILPDLLRSPEAEVRKAALDLAAIVRTDAAKAAVLDILTAPGRPSEERRLALSAIRGYEDRELAPRLATLYESTRDAAFLGDLLRLIAALDRESAVLLARKALGSDDSILRGEAIGVMGQKPETALEVARGYNAGSLPKEDLARVIEAVRGHASPELQQATQVLLRDRLLKAPTGDEARKLREFVAKNGSAARQGDLPRPEEGGTAPPATGSRGPADRSAPTSPASTRRSPSTRGWSRSSNPRARSRKGSAPSSSPPGTAA